MKNLTSGLGIWQILNSNIITDIIAKAGFFVNFIGSRAWNSQPSNYSRLYFHCQI